MTDMRIKFDRHGLGDVVHVAHLLQLYKRHGYNVSVNFGPRNRDVAIAAGLGTHEDSTAPDHPWMYFDGWNVPLVENEYSSSKIGRNINEPPLPYLGNRAELWEELCGVNLEGAMYDLIGSATQNAANVFLATLPRPVILLHTHGNSWADRKNLADWMCLELYKTMLHAGAGLVLLDWHFRVPMMDHANLRHVGRDWEQIGLRQLAALYRAADLLIGIDSGPLHFASLTDLPALGVFHQHYPTCVSLPRARNVWLCRGGPYAAVNAARNASGRWNIVSYSEKPKHIEPRPTGPVQRKRWKPVDLCDLYPSAEVISMEAFKMLQSVSCFH